MEEKIAVDNSAIRPMVPSDVAQVVEIHLRSFEEHFLTALGRRFLRLYYKSLLGAPRGIALVHCREERVLGFAVGLVNPRPFYDRLLRRRWLHFGIASLPALLRRPTLLPQLVRRGTGFAATHPPAEDAATLSSIAVSPEAAGSGIGTALMKQFVAAARERGARSVHWAAKKHEEQALKFYQKVGASEVHEMQTPEGEEIIEYTLRV